MASDPLVPLLVSHRLLGSAEGVLLPTTLIRIFVSPLILLWLYIISTSSIAIPRSISHAAATSRTNAYGQPSPNCIGMASPAAVYRPLNEQEIRLVVLLPGFSRSRIQCKLVHQDIRNYLPYEAVSYTWGDPNITEVIILNGRPFTVTAGLARALRHFRHAQDRLILWIDAICINQRDDEEKNHQVQMMLDIYRNSTRVRAWIGRGPGAESEDHLRPLQDKLNRVAGFRESGIEEAQNLQASGSSAQQDPWNVWNLIDTFGKLADLNAEAEASYRMGTNNLPSISESLRSLKAWKDLCLLLLRPYWRRVWIQQEIMEVPKVVVHCGSKTFPLSSLYNLCTNFFSYYHATKQSGSEVPFAVSFISESYLQIYNLQEQSKAENDQHIAISNLLRDQIFKQTSDPRDKIYGIVGLIPSWRHTFPIDYKLSKQEVYIALFKYVVQRYNRLDLLANQIRLTSSRLIGLPSWCPDWSQTVLPQHLIPETKEIPNLYEVPKSFIWRHPNRLPVYSFARHDHVLIARGMVLDICEKTTFRFGADISFLDPSQKKLRDDTLKLARSSLGGPYWSYWQSVAANRQPLDHEKHLVTIDIKGAESKIVLRSLSQGDINLRWSDQEEAMLRTLIGNEEEYFNKDLFERYRSQNISLVNAEGVGNALNQNTQAESLPGALASSSNETDRAPGRIYLIDIYPGLRKLELFGQATRHRRFFMSYKKYMGLAPVGSKPGDFVCILFGCNQPVILRQVDGHYIFIGEVYFHGWMNGEALSHLDSRHLQAEDFEIH